MLFSPIKMHIPDGFLSTTVAVAGWILAFVLIWIAIRQTRDQLGERQVPLMGILASLFACLQVTRHKLNYGSILILISPTQFHPVARSCQTMPR